MCGIVGMFSCAPLDTSAVNIIAHLTKMMARRGPDDEGFFNDSNVAFGFRRLAILDLSPTGHQPMLTRDERYVIIFNGEIYNFKDIRADLEKHGLTFRSTGDTEVILNALALWGVEALDRFNGMFALAFYDRQEKRLLLARDHAGIKPLYYLRSPRGLVFGSQFNQLLAHPWRQGLSLSADAVGLYLRLGYIPAPYAALENTHMLEPGSWLQIDANGQLTQGQYYKFPRYRQPDLFGEEAVEAVNAAVTDAVRRQMISDVPLGTFLSGGIDSPLVAAKMRTVQANPILAFTVGTNGDEYDESPDAMRIGSALGLKHIVEQITPEHSISMLDDVIAACGEPFADYSIFPTMLVSRLARQHVTVMLSGDGGDELFWGYTGRMGSVLQAAQDFRQPHWFRSLRWGLKKYADVGNGYLNLRQPSVGNWVLARHTRLFDHWLKSIFPDLPPWPSAFDLFEFSGWEQNETAQWLRWNEFVGHLTMVLQKVDRASMYHSLEVRVPLLDREVIEVATRVDWKSCLDLHTMTGKMPLRRALSKHLATQSLQKRGFAVPMGKWLRTSLRSRIQESLLNRNSLANLPINKAGLQHMVDVHWSERTAYDYGLWVLLSFALWEDRHFQQAPAITEAS